MRFLFGVVVVLTLASSSVPADRARADTRPQA